MPRTIYAPLAEASRLYISYENSDECGFLIRGPYRTTLKIYQTCVQFDARRREHASDAVEQLIQDAIDNSVHQITLHCAEDLPANEFWQALGFKRAGERVKNKRTGRRQLRWWYDLPEGLRHRQNLDACPTEQMRNKLLDLAAKWKPNEARIKKAQAKRRE